VGDVLLAAREKVIEADDLMALGDELVAKVTAEEAGSAGDKDAHDGGGN
jgi:hypothetical protein